MKDLGVVAMTDIDMMSLEQSNHNLELVLQHSQGELAMSNDEVKIAIMRLKFALEAQISMNQTLINRVEKLENTRSFFRFWKK